MGDIMEQDFAAAIDRAKERLKVIPLSGSTERASAFDVRFDGGAFTLHVYDVREAAEPRAAGLVENWQTVEVGRFSLSPQAFSRLAQSLAQSGAAYAAVMGRPVPTEEDFMKATATLIELAKAQQASQPQPHLPRKPR